MPVFTERHEYAMGLAAQGDNLAGQGKRVESQELYAKAYSIERGIAFVCATEPNRAIMLYGAAALAFKCELFSQSRELIAMALAGHPPEYIKSECATLGSMLQRERAL